MKFYLILLISTLLFSCTNNKTENKSSKAENAILIDETDLEELVFDNYELIEDYHFVPLETSIMQNLIGLVSEVAIYKNRIFVLDRQNTKTLYIFSESEKFLKQINVLGDGPGEFKKPFTFTINSTLNQIVLYCKEFKKLLFYDLDGNFLKEQTLGLYLSSIEFYHDKYFIFTHSTYNFIEKYGELPYDLMVLDTNLNIIDKQFHSNTRLNIGITVYIHNSYFTQNNNKLFVSWVMNDTIYMISNNNSANSFCYFDYGKYSLPKELIENSEQADLYKAVKYDCLYTASYASPVYADGKIMTSILTNINQKNKSKGLFVLFTENLKTKNVFERIEFKDNDAIFNYPITNYGNYFVTVIYPEELIETKSENNDYSPIKLKGIKKEITKFDNPVLMFTKFK